MAEYYVTATAGGGGVGSEADPFTLAEARALAETGNIFWCLTGAYTIESAGTCTAGDSTGFNLYIAYSSTIGDLSTQGRNSDGSLNTTNFPTLTITDSFTVTSYVFFLNWDISGSYAGDMLGASTSDNFGFINCAITNSVDSTLSTLFRGDDQAILLNCDLTMGANFSSFTRVDNSNLIAGCRFVVTGSTSLYILRADILNLIGNYVSGNGQQVTNISDTITQSSLIIGNTFYNCGDVIVLPNQSMTYIPIMINNHATDSDQWVNSQYSATANVLTIELNNRLRDITTDRTGIGNNIQIGEVTTDTGGPETDYTDYANGDLSLIDGAPGVDSGLGFGSWNIGAQQDERAGSTTTGGVINDGLNGGFNG